MTAPLTRDQLAAKLGGYAGTQGGYGDQAQSAYLTGAQNFDASKSLNNYAQGAWGSISTALQQQLKQLGGAAVGQGRYDSGFFDADQGTVIRGALNDFSNNIAQQSMNAASLQERNTESLGQFGSQAADRSASAYGDLYTQAENDNRDAQAYQRQKKSGIGSAIGGVLGAAGGAFFGGGAGAGIGAKLGSSIGSLF